MKMGRSWWFGSFPCALHQLQNNFGLSISLLAAAAAFAFSFLTFSFFPFLALLFRFLTAVLRLVRIFWHVWHVFLLIKCSSSACGQPSCELPACG